MSKKIRIITALLAISMISACADDGASSSSLPHYNSAVEGTHVDSSSATGDTASTNIPTAPIGDIPVISTAEIVSGNSFEQQQYFGFYCRADSGFYYVDRTGDGFLYHYSNGKSTLVLAEYTRALHYYNGKLFYLKGSKEQFDSEQHFYGGDVWCYDIGTSEETCIAGGIADNRCLAVNEYGIFCNPHGGGVALYDFDGSLIKVYTEKNQNICVLDNYIYLKQEDGCVMQNLDDGTTVPIPDMGIIVAYSNGTVIYADKANQSQKYCVDLKTGQVNSLPENEAYSFAWLDNELYASDNHNIYKANFEECKFEPIITLDITGQMYIFSLFSDGEKLYAEAVNQSGIAALAEVLTDGKTLDWGDNAV